MNCVKFLNSIISNIDHIYEIIKSAVIANDHECIRCLVPFADFRDDGSRMEKIIRQVEKENDLEEGEINDILSENINTDMFLSLYEINSSKETKLALRQLCCNPFSDLESIVTTSLINEFNESRDLDEDLVKKAIRYAEIFLREDGGCTFTSYGMFRDMDENISSITLLDQFLGFVDDKDFWLRNYKNCTREKKNIFVRMIGTFPGIKNYEKKKEIESIINNFQYEFKCKVFHNINITKNKSLNDEITYKYVFMFDRETWKYEGKLESDGFYVLLNYRRDGVEYGAEFLQTSNFLLDCETMHDEPLFFKSKRIIEQTLPKLLELKKSEFYS